MGFLSKEIGREFIAVPDDKKHQIVFKWPDVNIRRFAKAIVEPDEIALFLNAGQVIGVMPPGRHDIDADELPFLGIVIDHFTNGNAYRAELYFVGTREYTSNTFGGRVDNVQDPQTGMLVTLAMNQHWPMYSFHHCFTSHVRRKPSMAIANMLPVSRTTKAGFAVMAFAIRRSSPLERLPSAPLPAAPAPRQYRSRRRRSSRPCRSGPWRGRPGTGG